MSNDAHSAVEPTRTFLYNLIFFKALRVSETSDWTEVQESIDENYDDDEIVTMSTWILQLLIIFKQLNKHNEENNRVAAFVLSENSSQCYLLWKFAIICSSLVVVYFHTQWHVRRSFFFADKWCRAKRTIHGYILQIIQCTLGIIDYVHSMFQVCPMKSYISQISKTANLLGVRKGLTLLLG